MQVSLNKIEQFVKDCEEHSDIVLLEEGKEKNELEKIAKARGILTKGSRDLAVFKTIWAFSEKANSNGAILPSKELLKVLPQIVGKPVNINHNRRLVVGSYIDYRYIQKENKVIAYGIFYKSNFKKEWEKAKKLFKGKKLASSFEIWSPKSSYKYKEDGSYEMTKMEIAGGALIYQDKDNEPAFNDADVLAIAKKMPEKDLELVYASKYKEDEIVGSSYWQDSVKENLKKLEEEKQAQLPKIKCSHCQEEIVAQDVPEIKCPNCFSILNTDGSVKYPPQVKDFKLTCPSCRMNDWLIKSNSDEQTIVKCKSCAKEYKLNFAKPEKNEMLDKVKFLYLSSVNCIQCGARIPISGISDAKDYEVKCHKCGIKFNVNIDKLDKTRKISDINEYTEEERRKDEEAMKEKDKKEVEVKDEKVEETPKEEDKKEEKVETKEEKKETSEEPKDEKKETEVKEEKTEADKEQKTEEVKEEVPKAEEKTEKVEKSSENKEETVETSDDNIEEKSTEESKDKEENVVEISDEKAEESKEPSSKESKEETSDETKEETAEEIEDDSIDEDVDDLFEIEEAQKKVQCECIKCGHKLSTAQHCKDIKCPECGGTMRRADRPGPGQSKEEDAKELEYKERKKLKDSSFAVVKKVKNKNTGKTRKIRMFPINDKAHVRNALARLPQATATLKRLGVSPRTVKARILKRAKQLGMKSLLKRNQASKNNIKTYNDEIDKAIDKILELKKAKKLEIAKVTAKATEDQNTEVEKIKKEAEEKINLVMAKANLIAERRLELGSHADNLSDKDIVKDEIYEKVKMEMEMAKMRAEKANEDTDDLVSAKADRDDDFFAQKRKEITERAFRKRN